MTNSNEVLTWLEKWFVENGSATKADLQGKESENFFSLGWIDSLKFVQLISDVETDFSIQFSNDQFTDRTFSTLTGLAEAVQKLRDV
jgi:acyl carrier protein